jgi:predicted enzyme related to lactoylglutathione lyase
MAGAQSGGGGTIVYFRSEDCAVEAGRVVANGGKVVKDKVSIGQYGFMVLASDPDGNIFGIHSMR